MKCSLSKNAHTVCEVSPCTFTCTGVYSVRYEEHFKVKYLLTVKIAWIGVIYALVSLKRVYIKQDFRVEVQLSDNWWSGEVAGHTTHFEVSYIVRRLLD